ncbi:metallophosphoesterase family protein [Bradyrhizobium sp. DASA03076]|uniref:metallophosphoesterase family protein n=1 Tax=Bradyrhizobium sp. BLXBL-03 TaxID=3395916 RepID=UPI003F7251E5
MARIAHISDIHFGRSFVVDVWNRIKDEIAAFHPKTIIASGDFTDDPDPLLLLAAKSELQDLCKRCGEGTEFFVVPGNHDLLDLGNILHPGSAKWFDRVMFRDTTDLRNRLQADLGFPFGLNEETLRWTKFPRFRRMRPSNWLSLATRTDKCDGRLQSCDYRRAGRRWPTRSIHDRTLITCLDSNNPSLRQFVFATGTIGRNQIERIKPSNLLPACPCCARAPAETENGGILLRVAVLHHHPMPIAVRDKSLDDAEQEARLEPFLILKNSGDLVHELQRLKYDLVLHGHKHRPQFARVELGADRPERYPILVLAGGSTAKRDEDPSDNTLRDIGTEPNGRLRVRTFWQGNLQDERNYCEPIEILKRRAFARALDRTGIKAKHLISDVVIDEVGHLRSLDTTSHLRVMDKDRTLTGLVSNVDLAAHDTRLDVELEEGSDRAALCVRDDPGNLYRLNDPRSPADSFYWLNFHEPLAAGQQPFTFAIREAAANSMAMSQWEIEQRSHGRGGAGDPDYGYEEVGSHISYPIEKLTIRVTFPPNFEGIAPRPRCRRHPAMPDFPLRYLPEQRPRRNQPGPQLISDDDLAKEEMRELTYDARDRAWEVEIDHPIPGCSYSLQWRVPDPRAPQKVCDRSTAYRKMLARLVDPSCDDDIVEKCRERFDRLARSLMKRFHFEYDDTEKQTVFLMLYEPADLCLRPALTQGPIPDGNYQVPLGGGVAGAAFLQRQIIAWKNDPNSKSLIRPASSGALNSHWVLALPVFHQGGRNAKGDELDTEPGAVLAVITLGSDSAASRISECAPNDDDPKGEIAKEIGQDAQILAQQCVFDMLRIIGKVGDQADPVVPTVP